MIESKTNEMEKYVKSIKKLINEAYFMRSQLMSILPHHRDDYWHDICSMNGKYIESLKETYRVLQKKIRMDEKNRNQMKVN